MKQNASTIIFGVLIGLLILWNLSLYDRVVFLESRMEQTETAYKMMHGRTPHSVWFDVWVDGRLDGTPLVD